RPGPCDKGEPIKSFVRLVDMPCDKKRLFRPASMPAGQSCLVPRLGTDESPGQKLGRGKFKKHHRRPEQVAEECQAEDEQPTLKIPAPGRGVGCQFAF